MDKGTDKGWTDGGKRPISPRVHFEEQNLHVLVVFQGISETRSILKYWIILPLPIYSIQNANYVNNKV